MAQGCGNCLFQGKIKSTNQGIEVVCLFHEGQRFKDSYICDNYRVYIEMPLSDRTNLALEAKNHIETQKRHQETVEVAKEANKISKESNDISRSAKRAAWWAFWIAVASLIISVLVAVFK